MDYMYAWGIAAIAGIACLGFFFLVTRRIGSIYLRILLRCLGAAWILLPAPVPGYPGNFAPAFVVWVFEGVLKSDGDPLLSLQILLWSSLAVITLVSLWYLFFGRHKTQGAEAEENSVSEQPDAETSVRTTPSL